MHAISQTWHGPRLNFIRWNGLKLITIENERIRVVIWPEHGADILEFRHKATDIDVLWKNRYNYPPKSRALDLPHGGRSEFYDVFHGGWFVSLPSGFFPGDYFGALLGCHGELHSIPWEVEVLEQSAQRVRIALTGSSVRTPLKLNREIILETGEPFLRWTDTLYNRADMRLPVAWLQHPGFGGPFIEGAELVTAASSISVPPADRPELSQLVPEYRGVWPRAKEQQTGIQRDCSKVPNRGSKIEHVVQLTDWEYGWGSLWNPRFSLGFGLRWDEDIYPYAWSWAAGCGNQTYPLWGTCHTITLQPSTSPLLPFAQLLEKNEVLWVEGHGQVATPMTVGFTTRKDEVLEL